MNSLQAGTVTVMMALVTAACAADRLPEAEACLITESRQVPITLELAKTPDQRRNGLMARTSLDDNSGMLFLYQTARDPDHGFWMYKTRIPLDIAYLDKDGTIGAIRQMAPCDSSRSADCPSYPAGVSFLSALEMNQGFFDEHKVQVGDRLVVGEEACRNAD
ncbi:DUF192 domain-containing protein [Marinobacter sp.]|uniref:DUF192 domain-containing protein n=1 Tax=Marinobacter sp. TaxID=50741 RepID=UPI0034A2A717